MTKWNKTTHTNTRESYETTTKSGNRFIVEIIVSKHDKKSKNSIMNLWLKHGYLKNFIEETLHVHTYYYDEKGNCWGKYNIQCKNNHKINFNYILENTLKNKEFLINECLRLANEE